MVTLKPDLLCLVVISVSLFSNVFVYAEENTLADQINEDVEPITVYKYYSNNTTVILFKPNQKLDIQTFKFLIVNNAVKTFFSGQDYWQGHRQSDSVVEFGKMEESYGLYLYKFVIITKEPSPTISWQVLGKNIIISSGNTDNISQITESDLLYKEAYDMAYNVPNFVDFAKPPEYYVEQYHANPQFYRWYSEKYPYYTINDAVGITKEKYKQILDDLETELNTGPKVCTEGAGFTSGYCVPARLATCEARLENGLCVTESQPHKSTSDSDTKLSYKTGLQKGQWVKYQILNFDVGSKNPYVSEEAVQQAFLKAIIPTDESGNIYADSQWIKMKIDDVMDSKFAMASSVGLPDGQEKVLWRKNLVFGDTVFVIPTNLNIGDSIVLDDNEFRVEKEVKVTVNEKQIDALKLVSNQVISNSGFASNVTLENIYHKQSGMLLMASSKAHGEGSGSTFDISFTLNAVDVSDHFVQVSAGTGNGCLIATAAFGSELAPQVQLLREIRDNVLFGTRSGTEFMAGFNAFYYSFSPTVADWERQNPILKEIVKITITPMLSILSILDYFEINSEQEMLGYGVGIILLNVGMYFVLPVILIMNIKQKLNLKYSNLHI